MKIILGFVVVFFISGCAYVAPLASLEQDKIAKDFSSLHDEGALFIYRNVSSHDDEAPMVLVNGKILGFTAGKTYFRVNVQPGTYSITSKVVDHSKPSIVTLNVDSGKNYFIWQEVYSNGFSHETRLHQVNEEEGRKGVLESQLIANTISDREISLDVSNNDKTSSVSKKLRELQSLRNDNVITADEYEIKRKQLMNEL